MSKLAALVSIRVVEAVPAPLAVLVPLRAVKFVTRSPEVFSVVVGVRRKFVKPVADSKLIPLVALVPLIVPGLKLRTFKVFTLDEGVAVLVAVRLIPWTARPAPVLAFVIPRLCAAVAVVVE
jgi:hypothetical protein